MNTFMPRQWSVSLGAQAVPLATLVCSTVSLSCSSSSAETTAWTVEDSAGVRVVTTHRLEWEGSKPWWGARLLVLPQSGSDLNLSLVGGAGLLPDGRVVVADLLEDRAFVFSGDGALLDSLGGPGAGPGEFTALTSLEVSPHGDIRVFDRSLRRISTFSADGILDRVVTLQGNGFESGELVSDAWLLEGDGALVWEHVERDQRPISRSSAAERWVTPGRLRVVDLATGRGRILLEMAARDWIVEGSRWWVSPFGPRTTLTIQSRNLYISPGATHEVSVVTPDSGVVATYRYPAADEPFDRDLLRNLEDEARQEAREEGGPFMAGVLFAPELQPTMLPAIQGIRVRPDGTIWAQVHTTDQVHAADWWVISPEGHFRGVVTIPGRRDILEFTDSLALLVSLDELDIPSVELWHLPPDH